MFSILISIVELTGIATMISFLTFIVANFIPFLMIYTSFAISYHLGYVEMISFLTVLKYTIYFDFFCVIMAIIFRRHSKLEFDFKVNNRK